MKKLYLLAAALLLSVWVFAQTTSPGEQQAGQAQTGTQAEPDQGGTIEGCLAGSNGSFTLTDNSGKSYQLAGDTSKLSEHVGHTLRISGSQKSEGDPQGGAGSSGQPTFTVQKVKMVSSSCPASK